MKRTITLALVFLMLLPAAFAQGASEGSGSGAKDVELSFFTGKVETIDVIDESLLSLLGSRMGISRQIGEYKKVNNIAILQTSRWDSILEKMIAKGAEYGLSEHFVTVVFNAIHDASVQVQNDILSDE